MKFIRINMSDKTIKTEHVPEEYMGLGGRGLTSIMINAEVMPSCDPLGPDNKLIFAPGLLSGTPLVNTSRLSVGAKSPLTGGIKESNVGGTVANAVAKLGITAIIIEGQAPAGDLSILRINEEGEASLTDGGQYKGMRTYALVKKLRAEYGRKISVSCIGPAGEYQLASASIQTSDADDRPCRAAGRGGLGAVMGAKGIKALVVDRGGKLAGDMLDPDAFKAAAKVFAKAIRDNQFSGQILPALGTAALVSMVNSMGAFPSYNATKGQLEGFEKISGETMAKTIKERGGQTTHVGCTGCVAQCSNVFVDKNGKYVTSSLEYETLWSMGGMPGITDLDVIAKLDFLCDDIGLDTMNTGVAIGVAMDAGYREFGHGQAAMDMLEEVAKGSEIGRAIGNGPSAVGKHFNHSRVPVVKNQSIAAYDPRGMQGNGVTYATSTMGADHTSGNLIGQYLGGMLDPLSPEGQVKASRNAQITMASLDNSGLCLLVGGVFADPVAAKAFGDMLKAKFGVEIGPADGPALGMRILKAERTFNAGAGLTKEDDRLPKFFLEEPLPPHNKTFLIPAGELDTVFNF
ncbi:MAG: aldehyde ferredoxin oxidoreductase [Deltaproteobacteria bacterium]|nr:aldehyde ferredoxin oxidoreductase [Deltaproteobacteria bacterium]